MKIELPLETWTDIFGFLTRSQLAEFCPQIRDRQFASFIQFFLHKCGQITFGKLYITKAPNGNGPIIFRNNQLLPLAKGPIPPNVVNFKEIRLSCLNSSVLEFMQELQRNSLLENVNLTFDDCSDDMLASLDTILSLITSIGSIVLFDILPCKSAYSQLVKPMLKSARYLETWDCLSNDWYCEWLYALREDGKPRLLLLHTYGSRTMFPFIELLKKDFLSSKKAISFFIRLYPFAPNFQLELQNGHTNETFEIKLICETQVLISRHPIGANEEWIEEMSKIPNNDYRNIILDC